MNWNGDVSPSVFLPYSPVNVRDVFAKGGTLDEVWAHPFFADIRRWQRDYGHRDSHEPCPDCGKCGGSATSTGRERRRLR